MGYTDKRPVIYALIKLLQATGDIAFITNDRHFRRLLPDHGTVGHFNNVLIAVTDCSPDEVFIELEHGIDDFEHVIFDTQDMIPNNPDLILYVKGYDFDDEEKDILECIENYTTIKMCYSSSEKNSLNLQPTADVFKAVEMIENKKLMVPIPARGFNQGLANLLAPKLKMQPKSALQILNRGWNQR